MTSFLLISALFNAAFLMKLFRQKKVCPEPNQPEKPQKSFNHVKMSAGSVCVCVCEGACVTFDFNMSNLFLEWMDPTSIGAEKPSRL